MRIVVLASLAIMAVVLSWPPGRSHPDYDRGVPERDAAARYARGHDRRLLAIGTPSPGAFVVPGDTSDVASRLQPGFDVCLLPAVPEPAAAAQIAYVRRYNVTIEQLRSHDRATRSRWETRQPTTRVDEAIMYALVLLPIAVYLLLWQRLKPFRRRPDSWAYRHWNFMRPSLYDDEARPLLRLVWATTALMIPFWIFVGLFVFGDGPGPC